MIFDVLMLSGYGRYELAFSEAYSNLKLFVKFSGSVSTNDNFNVFVAFILLFIQGSDHS